MDEFDDSEIAKLLRLKKYEQPPPRYFEDFLHEFQRRQRDELLRQPLWRVCLDRAHEFMFKLSVPSVASYPMAAAALLVCAAVVSLKIYQHPQPANVVVQSRLPALPPAVNTDVEWSLASPMATRVFVTQPLHKSQPNFRSHRTATPPRYVLDSVPVSYESNFRF